MKIDLNKNLLPATSIHRRAIWETAGISAANIAVFASWSAWLTPVESNPSLFWLLAVPLVLTLFYGSIYGVLSGIATLITMRYGVDPFLSVLSQIGWLKPQTFSETTPLSLSNTLPALLWLALAGESRDYWRNHAIRSHTRLDKTKQRLERFSRNYQLLKASHDALINSESDAVPHLRGAIRTLKAKAIETPVPRLAQLAESLLQLFAEHGALRCAGLYEITHPSKITNTSESTNVALQQRGMMGMGHQLILTDPMLQRAIETGELQFVDAKTPSNQTRYQLCIPFVDSSGYLQALLVAESIRFFALNTEHLKLLTVLSHQCADLLNEELVSTVFYQNQEKPFLDKIKRAREQAKHYNLQACVVTLVGSADKNSLDLRQLTHLFRDMDTLRLHTARGAAYDTDTTLSRIVPALSILMPLTTEEEALSAIRRVDHDVQKQTQKNLADWGIHTLPPEVFVQ